MRAPSNLNGAAFVGAKRDAAKSESGKWHCQLGPIESLRYIDARAGTVGVLLEMLALQLLLFLLEWSYCFSCWDLGGGGGFHTSGAH